MSSNEIPTQFAPAARSSAEEVERQSRMFLSANILKEFADAVPGILLVLNRNRQIVHANSVCLPLTAACDISQLLGRRPGEALHCTHSSETEGGCGTTVYCSTCGAVKAILTCQRGDANTQECRIVRERNIGSLDLRIVATPMRLDGEEFTLFAATDIADEKRREVLERLFFHDVLNTTAGLQGFFSVLENAPDNGRDELVGVARQLVRRLVEEINAQREIVAAEQGDIVVRKTSINSRDFLSRLLEAYTMYIVADLHHLALAPESENISVDCDERLLHRVVGNMIKNALESSAKGETVTAGCRRVGGDIEFWVHNRGCMPREVQLQIFQRSFSTKGTGRGLGTHSIKLLGEKYLGGKVTFSSSSDEGTTFRVRLPLQPLQTN